MYSLQIVNGDIAFDARGKGEVVQGHQKVSNQVNYALSTSPFIQNLFLPNGVARSSSNEAAVREAIYKTLNSLIAQHAANTKLPSNESLVTVSNLQVVALNKTSFQFIVTLTTKAGSFSLNFNRGN
jgi:hypothetical protein